MFTNINLSEYPRQLLTQIANNSSNHYTVSPSASLTSNARNSVPIQFSALPLGILKRIMAYVGNIEQIKQVDIALKGAIYQPSDRKYLILKNKLDGINQVLGWIIREIDHQVATARLLPIVANQDNKKLWQGSLSQTIHCFRTPKDVEFLSIEHRSLLERHYKQYNQERMTILNKAREVLRQPALYQRHPKLVYKLLSLLAKIVNCVPANYLAKDEEHAVLFNKAWHLLTQPSVYQNEPKLAYKVLCLLHQLADEVPNHPILKTQGRIDILKASWAVLGRSEVIDTHPELAYRLLVLLIKTSQALPTDATEFKDSLIDLVPMLTKLKGLADDAPYLILTLLLQRFSRSQAEELINRLFNFSNNETRELVALAKQSKQSLTPLQVALKMKSGFTVLHAMFKLGAESGERGVYRSNALLIRRMPRKKVIDLSPLPLDILKHIKQYIRNPKTRLAFDTAIQSSNDIVKNVRTITPGLFYTRGERKYLILEYKMGQLRPPKEVILDSFRGDPLVRQGRLCYSYPLQLSLLPPAFEYRIHTVCTRLRNDWEVPKEVLDESVYAAHHAQRIAIVNDAWQLLKHSSVYQAQPVLAYKLLFLLAKLSDYAFIRLIYKGIDMIIGSPRSVQSLNVSDDPHELEWLRREKQLRNSLKKYLPPYDQENIKILNGGWSLLKQKSFYKAYPQLAYQLLNLLIKTPLYSLNSLGVDGSIEHTIEFKHDLTESITWFAELARLHAGMPYLILNFILQRFNRVQAKQAITMLFAFPATDIDELVTHYYRQFSDRRFSDRPSMLTVLQLASTMRKRFELIGYMFELGARVNELYNWPNNFVEQIKECRINNWDLGVNHKDRIGCSVFHYAIYGHDIDRVKLFLPDADINQADGEGQMPLSIAINYYLAAANFPYQVSTTLDKLKQIIELLLNDERLDRTIETQQGAKLVDIAKDILTQHKAVLTAQQAKPLFNSKTLLR